MFEQDEGSLPDILNSEYANEEMEIDGRMNHIRSYDETESVSTA